MFPPTHHRPYPPPRGPWIGHMVWSDALFLHWALPPELVRSHVPGSLSLDLWKGKAWVTVLPFEMSELRTRAMPSVPLVSRFPEINIRTYVTAGGHPGAYFFSIEAPRRLPAVGMRAVMGLPYVRSTMSMRAKSGWVEYESHRGGAGREDAHLRVRYRPVGPVFHKPPGSLEYWLTQRYCLYSVAPWGQVLRSEIHHADWPLQEAEAEIAENTLLDRVDPQLGAPRLVQYCERMEAFTWLPTRVDLDEEEMLARVG